MNTKSSPKGKRAERPNAHAVLKDDNLRVVNGRVVTKTLADLSAGELKQARAKLFPNREAAIQYFHKAGVLTKGGKLTKNYGG